MKMSSLLAIQRILLINWVVAPALGIWIWVKSGFFSAGLFIIIWVIADKVWDWMTGLLIIGVGRIGVTEQEEFQEEISSKVPVRMASMMIVDILGTFILPWVIAGFFLGWFGTTTSLSTASAKEWWIAEYPVFIQSVENADNQMLFTKYRTGLSGKAQVRLTLIHKPNGGLILKRNLLKMDLSNSQIPPNIRAS